MARARVKSKAIKLCLDEVILDIDKQVEHDKDVFHRVLVPQIKKVMSEKNISFSEAKKVVKKERLNTASIALMNRDINLLNQ